MRRFTVILFAAAFSLQPHCAAQFTIGDNTAAMPVVNIQSTNVSLSSTPISRQTRLEMIRVMEAEFAYARIPLPKSENGLILKANGPLEPSGVELNDQLVRFGRLVKPGDRVQITSFEFKGNSIVFGLNGGPKKKEKWYQKVQVGSNGGSVPVAPQNNAQANGGLLTLTFDRFVPEMDAQQLRDLLAPIFDFTIKSPTQAYADTLPPKTKAAVLEHRALVGMNHEMLTTAKGSPAHKVRETVNGVSYEDWIYGDPPGEVEFVRFVKDEVVRIEVTAPGQEPLIRTAREVDLPVRAAEETPVVRPTPGQPTKPPSLRRADEEEPEANQPTGRTETTTRKIGFPKPDVTPGGPAERPMPVPTPGSSQ